jgi:hypothetical protein
MGIKYTNKADKTKDLRLIKNFTQSNLTIDKAFSLCNSQNDALIAENNLLKQKLAGLEHLEYNHIQYHKNQCDDGWSYKALPCPEGVEPQPGWVGDSSVGYCCEPILS